MSAKDGSRLPDLFHGRDVGALVGLMVLAAGLRGATGSPVVYNWDSVHYVLALDRYDILAHQPHPPGSYYYILLAGVARLFTGDPHRALLAISALSGSLYVLLLFALVRSLGGGRSAWLGAVLGATAPLFWFYGSVGLNYGPAGTLSAAVALGCVLACRSGSAGGVLLASAGLGLLGGFRPTDGVFLAPAYLWVLGVWVARGKGLSSGRRWGPPAAGVVLAGMLTLGWLVPNILNTGGLAAYLASIRGQEHLLGRSSALTSGWPAFHEAWITHQRSLESALGALWIGLVLALGKGVLDLCRCGIRRAERGAGGSAALNVLGGLIVGPAFAFYLLGHFASPGYTLVYAGFLAAVMVLQVGRRLGLETSDPADARRKWSWVGAAGVLAVVNTGLYLGGWPGWGPLGQRSLSYREIRDHADYYRDLEQFLRAHHPPGGVRLLASWNSTDGLRTTQFLLPEYREDIAQAVAELPDLPPALHALSFLRLITPQVIAREGRPTYAIVRTWEDPPYHIALFGRNPERVSIGPGHELYRIQVAPR